jgi:hypothetical protein
MCNFSQEEIVRQLLDEVHSREFERWNYTSLTYLRSGYSYLLEHPEKYNAQEKSDMTRLVHDYLNYYYRNRPAYLFKPPIADLEQLSKFDKNHLVNYLRINFEGVIGGILALGVYLYFMREQ